MASSIEDILMAKALADAESKPDPAVAMSVGGVGGALLGAAAGAPLNSAGMLMNKALGKSSRILRPGYRMAGGLVGAIAGGALGAGLANMMKQSSPAGNMLAKIQANGGELNAMDRMQLQSLLADIYGNM